ncbi:MAG: GldG family protein [Parasporobacterium sp.]|nr:GldG family protein [Parasporobacterium sp.]
MKNKNKTRRLNVLLGILLAVAVIIAVMINILVSELSDRYPLSVDLTANAAYDLGEDSKEILGNLVDEVRLYVLSAKGSFSGNTYLIQMRTLLEKYPRYSTNIHLEFIDYTTDPAFAAKYPDLTLSEGDVIVEGSQAIKQLPLANMFTYTYDSEGSLKVSESRVEEAVTSAIVSSVTSDPVYVGVLTGNDVQQDREVLEYVLSGNNYEVREVNMASGSFDDMEVLILLAPTQDLSEDVLRKLDDFLYNSGEYGHTLIYAAGAQQPELPNVNVFLREWGIAVEDGAVFETSENYAYGYQPYYPFVDYADDTFKDRLKDSSNRVLMPLARPLSTVFEYKDNKTVTTLLSFSSTSGVRPSDAGSNFTPDQAVKKGPMPALIMSTLMTGTSEKYSNVIVSGSSEAFASSSLSNTSIANAEYWIQMLNSITERGSSVSITAKSLEGNTLTITRGEAKTWSIILCVVLPLGIMAIGISVYLRRRYK